MQCIARQQGLAAARATLGAWKGYDTRLGMMDVLGLFKGETTLEQVRCCGVGGGLVGASERNATQPPGVAGCPTSHHQPTHTQPNLTQTTHQQVLEAAAGDRYATARASFAAALYFEARGDGPLALPLLRAVAALDGDAYGDGALRGLARCHLRVLEARLVAAAVAVAEEGAGGSKQHRKQQAVGGDGGEKGGFARGGGSFWGALVAGAWGVRTPSLDSSDGTASVSSLSSSRSWCARSHSGSGDEGLFGGVDEADCPPSPVAVRRVRSCRD